MKNRSVRIKNRLYQPGKQGELVRGRFQASMRLKKAARGLRNGDLANGHLKRPLGFVGGAERQKKTLAMRVCPGTRKGGEGKGRDGGMSPPG